MPIIELIRICQRVNRDQSQEVYVTALEKAAKNIANQNQYVLSDKPIEIIGICKKCLAA